jgi:cell division septation protein DedD
MHIETTNRICPLCKRSAATNGHLGPTRLCETCKLMIEPILPKRASIAIHPQYAVSTTSTWEAVEFKEKPDTASLLPQEEDYELVSFAPMVDAKKDFMEEAEEIFGRSAAPAETTSTEAFRSPAQPDIFDKSDLSKAADAPGGESFKSIGSTFDQAPATQEWVSLRPAEPIDESPDAAKAETVSESNPEIDESALDPWDDPLPAWDYSRNEWPLVVESKEPNALARFKVPIAIVALAACAIIAYFVFRPQTETPEVPISVATPELSGLSETKNTPETHADAQTPPTTPASNATTATSAPSAEGNNGNTQWRHSLQAMASQNEVEATEFAERLARAGVPAYVVSADLGRRGKWHRVRIGSFVTADDAIRFIGEARARAKAAGVTLRDLNLCDYEKP